MKDKLKILNSMNLAKKTVLIYITMAILPILIITVTANLIYTRYFLKQSYSFVEESAKNQEEVVKERLEEYKAILYNLAADKNLIQYAELMNNSTQQNWLVPREKIEGIFEDNAYTYDKVRTVSFFAENDFYANYSRWHQSSRDVIWVNLQDRQKVHDSINIDRNITYLPTRNLCNNVGMEDYVILLGCPVKDLRTKQQYGVLVMALSEDVLLFESENSGDLTSTVVVDGNNRILAGKNTDYIMEDLDEYVNAQYQKKGIYVRQYEIEDLGWSIVNILDMHALYRQIYQFDITVFVLMIVITLIFFLIVYLISKGYVDDINRIVNGITSFEQDSNQTIDVRLKSNDELFIIAERFNSMTARVQSLMNALKQKNEEIRIAAENQKHAEIVALEAQINPHFLYNTLESINWRAIDHGEEEISNMLGTLGSLLRYSVSNIDMEVYLQAEICWLEKYVFLQRDRFHNSFDCVYHVTDEAMEFPIYKMLLQPMIENIILHGFEDVKEGGLIDVTAFVRDDDKLQISVKDNGAGMTEEKLAQIREQIHGSGALSSKSIGISNVVHRLKIYYQENASMEVNSTLHVGTEVIMVIPRKEDTWRKEYDHNCNSGR